MHRNPVKRGLVELPEQWRWSSYRFYLLGEIGPVRMNEGWAEISFLGSGRVRPLLQAFVVPALRTEREGRGTQFIAAAASSKACVARGNLVKGVTRYVFGLSG